MLAGSVGAVVSKPLYGKPGKVKLVKVRGTRSVSTASPTITFPEHLIYRSPLAKRDRQKICTTFKILTPAAAPATGWVVTAKSAALCGWVKPANHQGIGNWVWPATANVHYHMQFDVTWSTKKKKKLAGATYDFNTIDDYQCTSINCLVDQGADGVPYMSFLTR